MIQINKKITPYNFTAMTNKKNEYIVIHYVGAVSTAKNNVDYYARERLQASAHYFVDADSIWQSVEDGNSAWHCGGGLQGNNGHTYYGKCKNSNSIGIEMCCFKDMTGRWFFANETVKNTVQLVKYLMAKHNIPIENVIRHYDVTGKICPAPYVDESAWKEFKSMVAKKEIIEYTDPNDIVWELANRKIVSDSKGMLNAIKQEPNGRLYWLARKTVQYMRERD